ncbi:uncharacterized protein LOC133899650 [Phragmites australis]|uniref:uncharacterized protein LOC133899650 n=1 Tax=Phragmites australis TaxID=29695 RepID=UPI002D781335|nr:uncharacterized protein LOC133899650 [Phragmites australis]
MALEAWRVLVRDRVVEAANRCGRASGLLTDTLGDLASPMHTADAWGGRFRSQLVDEVLTDASRELAIAASVMAAAELIALRGGAATPTAPLHSIDDVRDDEPDLRFALAQLQIARVRAEDACDSVELCRGHLWTALQLLDHPSLPAVDDILEVKRGAAHGNLDAARRLAEGSTSLARTAHARLR